MRENSKSRPERFDVSLSSKQVIGVLAVALVALGGAFLLGASAGRTAAKAVQPEAGRDALARLDEPLAARPEPAPELQAHQALTDHRSLDKAMPLQAQAPTSDGAASEGPESLTPPQVVATSATPAAAPGAVNGLGAPVVGAAPTLPGPAPLPAAARPAPPARAASPASGAARVAVHAAPVAKHGRYTIQVGSVPRRGDAERLASRLAARQPRIVAADVPGKGRWYRVQVGAFETRELASRQLASLGRSGFQGVVIAAR